MAKTTQAQIRVKGPIIGTPIGKALFVSAPAASQFDATKQEATVVLNEEDALALKAQLQDFIDSPEVKESGLKDTGFVDSLFKDDLDQDKNPTGFFRVRAKTSMQYPAKLYDAKGTVINPPAGFSIPNRADIRISFRPEVMKTSVFTGVVLRLQAIKIINMPSFDDGMGSEEDGEFSVDAIGSMTTPEVSTGDAEGWA